MTISKNIDLSRLQLALIETIIETSLTRDCPVKFELKGENENYLVCEITGLRIFLYADGFDVIGKEFKLVMEADDIASIEHAQKKLTKVLNLPN